ncbi:AMP-binding protein [Porphyromonadaceae bacterium OttesenSCG-928-L07]|nr:AMP-binding protein [Porphyromonadaceae bacterium OttesenSCG-928-L07]MDL2251648.1 AMP-binding protein [Odoribacter sp. OttesenSCG-928-J03]
MNTIIDLFENSVEKFSENPFLSEKCNGNYESLTYGQTHRRVRDIAGGLLAMGLINGERVALLSEGKSNWICSELGILYAGGVSVPLSMKLTLSELVFRINHSEARFAIVSEYFYNLIKGIMCKLPLLEKVFVMTDREITEDRIFSFKTLINTGLCWLESHADRYKEVYSSIAKDDVASISYTSGTTAEPKGIMLTHHNFVSNVLQADSLISIPSYYRILLFLPLDHSFAHTVGIYSFMYNGASIAFVDFGKSPMENLRNIPINMKEVKPHVLLSVPAIAKNFRKNIEAGIREKGGTAGRLYRWGLKIAYLYNGLGNDMPKTWYSPLLFPLTQIFDSLVFSKIRDSFGGNLQFFIGGGALLDIELQKYYKAIGIPMYQGYGLSETSPVISSNTPQHHIFGSSGQLVKPVELKICDENGKELPVGEKGEIVVCGGNVMAGYWKNPEATAEVMHGNWFFTGDMGYMTPKGYLYVLGRFKSLLIADDGEKFSPEGIEEAIAEKSEYIDYCVLYNNQSPYTSALIVPNKPALKRYVENRHLDSDSIEGYKAMLQKVHEELMQYRKGGRYEGEFPERWLPAVVAVLPDTFSEGNGTINSTAKVVRHKVIELYKKELEYIYTPEGKNITNERNMKNLKKLNDKGL